MRYLRKLSLVAAMTMATMALVALSASAGPVEVEDGFSDHCGTVTVTNHVISGGCLIHAVDVNDILIIRHIAGLGETAARSCDIEYDLYLGETGEGWINNVIISPGEALCVEQTPCTETGGSDEPWHAHVSHSGGSEFMVQRICIDIVVINGTAVSCEIEGNLALELVNTGGAYSAETEQPTNQGVPITARRIKGNHGGGVSHASCENIGSQLELHGHWNLESPEEIEIMHL